MGKSLGTFWIIVGAFFLLAGSPAHQKPLSQPVSEKLIKRKAYSLSYNFKHKQANWVYEHLMQDKITNKVDRRFPFVEDPLVPKIFRTTHEDYTRSGFDRGHLCPAADAHWSEKATRETFFLSNISPQCPKFNQEYWAGLERRVRELTKKHKALHVFTGPLYLPYQEKDGKRYIKYQVIGKNDIAVPTHYFKILFDKHWKLLEAYILPNEEISRDTPLDKFLTSVEKVEQAAGVVFLKHTLGK